MFTLISIKVEHKKFHNINISINPVDIPVSSGSATLVPQQWWPWKHYVAFFRPLSLLNNTFYSIVPQHIYTRKVLFVCIRLLSRSLFLTGCWIVTGGFQLGIMKLAGEAVRDYTDAYGGNRMLAFGVSSWGCVKKNDILEAALEEVSRDF